MECVQAGCTYADLWGGGSECVAMVRELSKMVVSIITELGKCAPPPSPPTPANQSQGQTVLWVVIFGKFGACY